MPQVTIIVEFETVEGADADFTRIMLDHAQRTLNEESGCLRFEVARPVDSQGEPRANMLVVNELYADRAAVEAHRANPRMALLGAAIKPLVKSRRLIEAQAILAPRIDNGIRPEDLSAANDD
ncbi:putative quinol monooxygenase [Arvimicrobium flavum]|uniref:putative quinol monooxygenase n=1 Tax=Arvimicrobium flavum TaxID=3393320 RepID=UPI00237A4A6B|nr:putative quinol monooxygenase [Mesorhizobium shangrilense]